MAAKKTRTTNKKIERELALIVEILMHIVEKTLNKEEEADLIDCLKAINAKYMDTKEVAEA